MSAVLHGQSLLRPILFFLNQYDLDAALLVNQDWNVVGIKIANARMASLRPALNALQLPPRTRCHLISLVNDGNVQETFEGLAKMEKVFGGVHLGVSCLHNWDYVVRMRSRFVILLDDNVYVSQLNSLAIKVICKSETRQSFKAAFFKKFDKMGQFNPDTHEASKRRFTAWEQEVHSAFSTEEGFRYIKNLAQQRRIVAVTCPLHNEQVVSQIVEIVRRAGLTFTSLYLGTKFERVISLGDADAEEPGDDYTQDEAVYRRNVERLKNDKTCIIDEERDWMDWENVTISQRISQGKDYDPSRKKPVEE